MDIFANQIANPTAILALASGDIFYGEALGIDGVALGEVIFNTATTGYQEILTDPSYAGQLVTFTSSHIGNTGINEYDTESDRVWLAGIILKEKPTLSCHWQSPISFRDYVIKQQIIGIAGIDTRYLTQLIRIIGSQSACLVAGQNIDVKDAVAKAQSFSSLANLNFIKEVSTKQKYVWNKNSHGGRLKKFIYHVVVCDFGVKQSILRKLVDRNCKVTVVPAHLTVADILSFQPHGVVLSNGPGDPRTSRDLIHLTKQLLEVGIPIFGICFGCQLLALAMEGEVVKMNLGHHGINHPVQKMNSYRLSITSQNHGFAINEKRLPKNVHITHRSLFDHSIQGIRHAHFPILGFQGHPEAGPGPDDAEIFFDIFIQQLSAELLCQKTIA